MLKSETEIIDGITFTATQFGAMRGFSILGRLVKTVGPAISVLSSANPDSEVSELAPAIAGALRDLDPDVALVLAVDVLMGTTALMTGPNGVQALIEISRSNLDVVFNGRLMTMFKVLAFVVKLNYSDFFAGSAPDAALPSLTP